MKLVFVSKERVTFDLSVVAAQAFVVSVAVPSIDSTPSVEAALAPVVPLEFSKFFEWLLHGSYPRLLFALIRTLHNGMTVVVSLQQRLHAMEGLLQSVTKAQRSQFHYFHPSKNGRAHV